MMIFQSHLSDLIIFGEWYSGDTIRNPSTPELSMEVKGESSGLDFSNFVKYIHYSEQKIDILSS